MVTYSNNTCVLRGKKCAFLPIMIKGDNYVVTVEHNLCLNHQIWLLTGNNWHEPTSIAYFGKTRLDF